MRRSIAALTVVIAAVAPSTASAAVFNVNTTTDQADAAQNGVCDASAATAGEQCTLRAAIAEAHANVALDRVNLPAGTFPLNSKLNATSNVQIVGAGARNTAITGASLNFAGSCSAGAGGLCSAELSDLTVRNGGGITSPSHLTLARVTVRDNTKGSSTSLAPFGGGVFVGAFGSSTPANLTMVDSTVSGNRAVGSPPFLTNGTGGGVAVFSTGTVTISNSTIAGNTATGEAAMGGGMGTMMVNVTVRNSTIAGNTAAATTGAATGGNFYRETGPGMPQPGSLVLTDSIVSGGSLTGSGAKTGPNCSPGAVTGTSGRNIDSGSSCGLASPSLSTTDPLLGPLGDNGGPTDVAPITELSPALNAALAACPATDQRGVTRPQGGGCDIGAFERVADTTPPGGDPDPPGGDPAPPSGDPAPPSGDPAPPSGDPAPPAGDPAPPGVTTESPTQDSQPGDVPGGSPGPAPFGSAPDAPSPAGRCARTMNGSARTNVLRGSPFGDRILGRGGDDRLTGGAGDDCLLGQGGQDRLRGGRGNDVLSGGRGDDHLAGGPGADVLKGGSGRDFLDARGGGRDIVSCGPGRDYVKADRTDRIRGGCERLAVR